MARGHARSVPFVFLAFGLFTFVIGLVVGLLIGLAF